MSHPCVEETERGRGANWRTKNSSAQQKKGRKESREARNEVRSTGTDRVSKRPQDAVFKAEGKRRKTSKRSKKVTQLIWEGTMVQ